MTDLDWKIVMSSNFTDAEKELIIAHALETDAGRRVLAISMVMGVPKLLTAKEKFMEELIKGLSSQK